MGALVDGVVRSRLAKRTRKLKESFSSVDDSQISSLVRAYQENSGVMPASCQWVGEGSDMEVWRVNGALMPLALRLWRQPILEKCSHEAKTKDWQGAMRRLDGAEGILVPPFWLISIRAVIGVVTPYGDLDVSRLGRHWQPLEACIAEFQSLFEGLGLDLTTVFRSARSMEFHSSMISQILRTWLSINWIENILSEFVNFL